VTFLIDYFNISFNVLLTHSHLPVELCLFFNFGKLTNAVILQRCEAFAVFISERRLPSFFEHSNTRFWFN